MKKNFKFYAACWAILLLLFNAVCFVTPSSAGGYLKFGGAFWVGYIFVIAAFAGQLVCAYIAFQAANLKKLFYNLPLVTLSYAGLVLTLILGGAAMVIPNLPGWAGALVCLLVLGFNAIAILKAKAAAAAVSAVDEKVGRQTGLFKSLIAEAGALQLSAQSEPCKVACQKVYNALRYSDPVSSPELYGQEQQIAEKFAGFAAALNNSEKAPALAEELVALIEARNCKCKLLK